MCWRFSTWPAPSSPHIGFFFLGEIHSWIETFLVETHRVDCKTSSVLAHLAHGLHPVVGDRDAQGHLIQPDGPGLCHDAAITEQAEDAAACWARPPDGTDGDQRRLIQPQQEVLQNTVVAISLVRDAP